MSLDLHAEAKSTPDNTGRKDDSGKAPIALVPHAFVVAVAAAYEDGRKKYGTWNYMRGMSALRLMSAVFRHQWAWLWGELCASDSGVHHLGHAGAGLGMLMQLEAQGKLIDDRYRAPADAEPAAAAAAPEAVAAPEPAKLKLEVGKTYRTEKGTKVKIVEHKLSQDSVWGGVMHPYWGDNHQTYTESGLWYAGDSSIGPSFDLVAEVTAPSPE